MAPAHCNHRTRKIIVSVASLFALSLLFAVNGCKDNGSIGAEDLANPGIRPRIVSTYPYGGTIGPYNLHDRGEGASKPNFVLVFNKLMEKGSFTPKSISVKGFDRPAAARLEGSYYWWIDKTSSTSSLYYDNVLSFFIVDSFSYYSYYSQMDYRIGQQYTITIDSTITDINGNHPSGQFTFTYLPEPNFRVISLNPKDGLKDVPVYMMPSIVFNSPVDQSILAQLHISPLTGGSWIRYPRDSIAVFFSGTQPTYPYNTTFTASVSSSAQDADHHLINRQYNSTFSTVAFRVSSTLPRDGETKVYLANSFSANFTGTLDTASIRAAFSISPAIPGYMNLSAPSSSFGFFPQYGFRPSTTYTVAITSALRASDGTPTVPSTTTFTTDAFRITQTYPEDGSLNVPRSNSIQFNVNAFISGATVSSAVSFSPPIPGYMNAPDGFTSFYYNPSSPLAANTTYTVTVSTGLGTTAGDHLLTPYSFTFTTGSN